MRHIPLQFDVFNAASNAQAGRDAEWRAMHRRPDALPLPEEPARTGRSLGWLARLARRSPAARARHAVG
jgi:hypothetical protein